jgi:hypothetical protein
VSNNQNRSQTHILFHLIFFFCLSFQFQLSCERCCCSIEDKHSHPNCGWK